MEELIVDTSKPPIPPPLVTIRDSWFGSFETRESKRLNQDWNYYINKYRYESTKNDSETASEKEQVEDIGETLANAIKEMPEGHKLKCYAVRREEIAVMDVQVIPDDQEFIPFGRETEPPDPAAKQTIIVNPDEWDDSVIDCPFADQDGVCLAAAKSVMYCRHCGLDDVLCMDKCPLEDGPVEVRLASK